MKINEELVDLALRYLSTPYVYAGNNPLTGMDCSGFVCWLLRSFGKVGVYEDLSAQGIFDKFYRSARLVLPEHSKIEVGTVLFFGKSIKEIEHVAIAKNSERMVEAGGAGSECTDKDRAAKLGACVRVRPIKTRKDFVMGLQLFD